MSFRVQPVEFLHSSHPILNSVPFHTNVCFNYFGFVVNVSEKFMTSCNAQGLLLDMTASLLTALTHDIKLSLKYQKCRPLTQTLRLLS